MLCNAQEKKADAKKKMLMLKAFKSLKASRSSEDELISIPEAVSMVRQTKLSVHAKINATAPFTHTHTHTNTHHTLQVAASLWGTNGRNKCGGVGGMTASSSSDSDARKHICGW